MREKFIKALTIVFTMIVGIVLWECGIVDLLIALGKWVAYIIDTASGIDPGVIDSSERTFWQKVIPGGR